MIDTSASPLSDFLDKCKGNPELSFLARYYLYEELQEDGSVLVKMRPPSWRSKPSPSSPQESIDPVDASEGTSP